MRSWIVVFILLICAYAGWASNKKLNEYKNKIDENQKSLSNVKGKIKTKLDEREKYVEQETRIIQEIASINKKREKISESIRDVNKRIEASEKKKSVLSEKVQIASLEINELTTFLNNNIERYYVDKFASQERFSPYSIDVECQISDIDNKVKDIEGALRSKREIEEKKNKLDDIKSKLNALMIERENERNEYAKLEKEKQQLQKSLYAKKNSAEKELEGLKKSVVILGQLLKNLEEEKSLVQKAIWEEEVANKKISSLKGKLAWPVKGKVVAYFGKQRHPEFDTYIFNNGIRIESIANQSVHAISRGRVGFVGEFKGYGKMIIVDHKGGYFSIYANLGEILVKEQQIVKSFEPIARLDSVLSKETLYFEFRNKGEAVDPLTWLAKK
ncbi:MAG: peptidoglycan DD-metalloendopeptidase family protein [bacterium]